MKFVDEFRDQKLARNLLSQIEKISAGRHWKIMEICGGHTHTIYRHGIEGMLPPTIELIHGPGCPVCVIPMGRLDDGIAIAHAPDVIFCTYGDMMRVPGSKQSLLDAKASGADIRMIYCPLDALEIAKRNPQKRVVFFAIGFETTTPATAITLLQAKKDRVENFSVFCNHILVCPAIEALLNSPRQQIDAFVGPGHVSTVIGTDPYAFIAQKFHRPVVAAGFEPIDILQGIFMATVQLANGMAKVENQYTRAVREAGNPIALRAIAQTMELRDEFEWRGLGNIPSSALQLRGEFADFDAERIFTLPGKRMPDPKACQCGEVLQGLIKPNECKVFGTACTPEKPIGSCMVSPEGACAAFYNYGRKPDTNRQPA